MSLFTKLNPNTTAEHAYFARSTDIMASEYVDNKNKCNLLNYYSKRFMIDQGLAPLPPDPRDQEELERKEYELFLKQENGA